MRGRLLSLGIISLTVVGLGAWWLVTRSSSASDAGSQRSTDAALSAAGPDASAERRDPDEFAGWAQWPKARQTSSITAIAGNPRLSLDIVVFLQRELLNRSLDPGTRNNIANALMSQDERLPGLAETFLRMVDDPQETLTWRDYSVQRLVLTLPPDADATPIANKLLGLIRTGPGSLPGTALIQLDLLLRSGRLPPSPVYAESLAQMAKASGAPLENRMTAVAKIGEHGGAAQLPVVRGLLTPTVEPALLRVTIATLGLIGERQDRSVVAGYLTHPNRGVVMAAEAAIKRLDARAL